VEEQTWTFGRGTEVLQITRAEAEGGYLLGVSGDGSARSYFFAELSRLQLFQADFEKFLLGTGWLFKSFSPDRRGGRDRRHFSRLMSDRRRWWTDGLTAESATPQPDGERDQRERRPRRAKRQQ